MPLMAGVEGTSMGGVAPALVVEPEQVPPRVLSIPVVVGPDLCDPALTHAEPLGAAVQPPLARLRVAPGHRPLDHGLVAVGDPMLVPPLTLDVVDRPAGVLGDGAGTLVRAEPRVVVDGVVGEVRGDGLDVARVERLVVGANVGERVAHGIPGS